MHDSHSDMHCRGTAGYVAQRASLTQNADVHPGGSG
jgi:hypothetical protein